MPRLPVVVSALFRVLTPIAEREHREAARHAEAMERHRSDVQSSILRLEEQQDDLLDRLNEAVG